MSFLAFLCLASLLSSGIYLMLSQRFSNALIGIALTSNGINVLLMESSHPVSEGVDPLPQALVLTAIVIGFALLAFVSAIVLNRIQGNCTDDIPLVKEEDSH